MQKQMVSDTSEPVIFYEVDYFASKEIGPGCPKIENIYHRLESVRRNQSCLIENNDSHMATPDFTY